MPLSSSRLFLLSPCWNQHKVHLSDLTSPDDVVQAHPCAHGVAHGRVRPNGHGVMRRELGPTVMPRHDGALASPCGHGATWQVGRVSSVRMMQRMRDRPRCHSRVRRRDPSDGVRGRGRRSIRWLWWRRRCVDRLVLGPQLCRHDRRVYWHHCWAFTFILCTWWRTAGWTWHPQVLDPWNTITNAAIEYSFQTQSNFNIPGRPQYKQKSIKLWLTL
jgi:hypothetical protein